MPRYHKAIERFPEEWRGPMREVLDLLWEDLSRTVAREEFLELKAIVEELAREVRALARAQERTEERIGALVEAQRRTEAQVEELTKAQRKTEERVSGLEEAVKSLAEAQRRTEERVSRLEEAVERLAEAQRRTEERLDQLAEAQRRTEERVEALAEAQRRTEQEVEKLAISLRDTRKMVGGLSDAVGYGLEDRAIKGLPPLLRERYGIEVQGRLVRKFVEVGGGREELNIFGRGSRDGEEVYILGEAKARLSKRHIDAFLKRFRRLRGYGVVGEGALLVMVTYSAEPEVQRYASERSVEVIWSYEV